MSNIKLIKGDCLEKFTLIKDKSIDLVLIDPPYNISKAEWDKWKTVDDYIEFMGKVFLECQRVLKDNGSFYFFHNDFEQMAELQHWIKKNTRFVFKNMITWNKTNFKRYAWTNRNPEKCKDRNWFTNVEYCLFYTFQNDCGLNVSLKQKGYKSLMDYFKTERDKLGWSYKECDDYLGIKTSYCYWDKPTTHPYRIPDKEKYEKLQKTGYYKIPYSKILNKYEELRNSYEGLRYTFNLKEVQENISCVWENENKNAGKLHPCEKPIYILSKIIKTSSNENDIVLDCFMGSASTGESCLKTNRNFIGIEKNQEYFNISCNRINTYIKDNNLENIEVEIIK